MRSVLIPLAVALGLAGPALAAGEVTDFKLDNGMEVVVIEDHRAPVVVHMVWYRAGAADEPAGRSGIAHFLEHLMFKATDTMPSGELSRVVEANGGSDNAFTTQDHTAYFQRVAADRLGLMMSMEADRMRHLRLTEDDIGTERPVILEERAMRTDNDPGALFREEMNAALYRNSPYGTPTIGWKNEIETLGRADALAFYRRFYAPNDAVLVVAGDVTPESVRALAEKYYGPLEPTPGLGARSRPEDPPPRAARRLVFADARQSQPVLMRSYIAPERNAGDQKTAAALEYLAELLGGSGATSVLGRALQFDTQTAVYTGASYSGVSLDPTSFTFVVVPSEGVSLKDAEAALDKTLAGFLEDGIDPARFGRIKSHIRAQQIYKLDDVGDLAQRYGAALTSGLTVADVQAWPEVLQSITPDDVMAAARALLDKRASVTGWLVPAGGEGTQ